MYIVFVNLTERWQIGFEESFISSHIITYPTPSNLNYMWSFGSMAGLCLVIQIVTGILLSTHYTPDINTAFASVEHIMNDVNYGWAIRYAHANGASIFFFVVYVHIFKGLYHKSYIDHIKLWRSGLLIFLLMMATAFMGYVLPWGQMSFWGATVITNLFSAIPFIGSPIVEWLWGGFSVSNATLNRFYSLHYMLPFIIAAIVIVHLCLLHETGSTSPLQMEVPSDVVSFYPYYYTKDLFSFLILVVVFSFFIFFYPNILGHPDNCIPADPLVTPPHIVPEWYFLPFYAILRSVPSKLGGVIAMFGSIIILLIMPSLSVGNSKLKSSKYRPIYKIAIWFFLVDFLLLGWLGQQPVEYPYNFVGLAATGFYFSFFYKWMPFINILEDNLEKRIFFW
jgi:ubiquinol-cytochrome c reductase cytochrome b subunit